MFSFPLAYLRQPLIARCVGGYDISSTNPEWFLFYLCAKNDDSNRVIKCYSVYMILKLTILTGYFYKRFWMLLRRFSDLIAIDLQALIKQLHKPLLFSQWVYFWQNNVFFLISISIVIIINMLSVSSNIFWRQLKAFHFKRLMKDDYFLFWNYRFNLKSL